MGSPANARQTPTAAELDASWFGGRPRSWYRRERGRAFVGRVIGSSRANLTCKRVNTHAPAGPDHANPPRNSKTESIPPNANPSQLAAVAWRIPSGFRSCLIMQGQI